MFIELSYSNWVTNIGSRIGITCKYWYNSKWLSVLKNVVEKEYLKELSLKMSYFGILLLGSFIGSHARHRSDRGASQGRHIGKWWKRWRKRWRSCILILPCLGLRHSSALLYKCLLLLRRLPIPIVCIHRVWSTYHSWRTLCKRSQNLRGLYVYRYCYADVFITSFLTYPKPTFWSMLGKYKAIMLDLI